MQRGRADAGLYNWGNAIAGTAVETMSANADFVEETVDANASVYEGGNANADTVRFSASGRPASGPSGRPGRPGVRPVLRQKRSRPLFSLKNFFFF